MFKRYADLFSEEENRARHREVQQRRRELQKLQPGTNAAIPKKHPSNKNNHRTNTAERGSRIGSP
jgi:hypothetical protein